jgi:hypothetical protein
MSSATQVSLIGEVKSVGGGGVLAKVFGYELDCFRFKMKNPKLNRDSSLL